MELLAANVDPDVEWTEIHVRVSRETEEIDIEKSRQWLVRNRYIDVLHCQNVSDIHFLSMELNFVHVFLRSRTLAAKMN